MYGGMTSHLPLKVNTANVIPIIFASSVLIFPATMAQFAKHPWIQTISGMLAPGQWLYEIAQISLIIFFGLVAILAPVLEPPKYADPFKIPHTGFRVEPSPPSAVLLLSVTLTRLTEPPLSFLMPPPVTAAELPDKVTPVKLSVPP